MQKVYRTIITYILIAGPFSLSTTSEAVNFQVFGGLENMKTREADAAFPDGTEFEGQTLGASIYMQPYAIGPLALLVGANAQLFSGEYEHKDKFTLELKSTLVGASVGAALSVIPKLVEVQVLAGYDLGIQNELKSKGIVGDTAIAHASQVLIDVQAFYKVFPMFSVGLGGGSRQTSIQVKDTDKATKFSGIAYKVVLMLAI